MRGGRNGEREDAALREGLAIAGWNDLADLSAAQTKDDIRDALTATYPDAAKATVANWTGQLWRFTHELSEDDWVVMPMKSRGGIAVGRVSGPYCYRPDSPPGFRQVRPVVWLRSDIQRSDIQQDLLDSMGSLLTICQLKRFEAARRIAALVEHGTDPGPSEREQPHRGLRTPHELMESAAGRGPDDPLVLSIRELLACWDATRRTPAVVEQIEADLAERGLTTNPPFTDGWLDNQIRVVPIGEEPTQKPETRQTDATEDVSGFPPITLRLSVLRSANQGIVSVRPTDFIEVAQSLMVSGNYSQLAVVDDAGTVHGAISWESIGVAAIARKVRMVGEALVPARIVHHHEDLLQQIAEIYQRGYVFVQGTDHAVSGIVTAADLTTQFGDLVQPFVLIEEAERRLRRRTDEVFDETEIRAVAKHRSAASAANLTMGNYKYLLRDPASWARFGWSLDHAFFLDQLEQVRQIRNELMHFSPDPLTDDQLNRLQGFVRLLRAVDPRE